MFDPEVGPLCSFSWFDFQLSVAPFYHFESEAVSISLSSLWLYLCLSLQTHLFDFWIVPSFFQSDSCYRGGLVRIPLVDWRRRLEGLWRRILFHLRISWYWRSVAATMKAGFITLVARTFEAVCRSLLGIRLALQLLAWLLHWHPNLEWF